MVKRSALRPQEVALTRATQNGQNEENIINKDGKQLSLCMDSNPSDARHNFLQTSGANAFDEHFRFFDWKNKILEMKTSPNVFK